MSHPLFNMPSNVCQSIFMSAYLIIFQKCALLLCEAVAVECYFTMSSRVSILHVMLIYLLLYTAAHLQIPFIPKTILIYNDDDSDSYLQ